MVPVVDENCPCRNRLIALAEGGNDYLMSYLHPMSGRSVYDNLPRTPFAFKDVRFEALAIIYIPHMNEFANQQIRALNKVPVDRNTAYIIDVGIGDGSTVNFAL